MLLSRVFSLLIQFGLCPNVSVPLLNCDSSVIYKTVICKNGDIGPANLKNRKKGCQMRQKRDIMQDLQISNLFFRLLHDTGLVLFFYKPYSFLGKLPGIIAWTYGISCWLLK